MKGLSQCLLVDDDQDDQEIFLMALEDVNQDIQCYTANDGVEALSMLESKKALTPDYIFLDVNMPKMNGIECLKGIKSLHHLQDAKVFMYSTTSDKAAMEKSKALGALDFIVKPPSHAALKAILANIFR